MTETLKVDGETTKITDRQRYNTVQVTSTGTLQITRNGNLELLSSDLTRDTAGTESVSTTTLTTSESRSVSDSGSVTSATTTSLTTSESRSVTDSAGVLKSTRDTLTVDGETIHITGTKRYKTVQVTRSGTLQVDRNATLNILSSGTVTGINDPLTSSESRSVSDSPSIQTATLSTLSASESITVSDPATITNASLGALSASESITVTDPAAVTTATLTPLTATAKLFFLTSKDFAVEAIQVLLESELASAWTFGKPEVYRLQEVTPKARNNNPDPALYIWSPVDTDLEPFSADHSRFNQTDTVEIIVATYDETKTARYLEDTTNILSKYMSNNHKYTDSWRSVEPESVSDDRANQVVRSTDHFTGNVTVTLDTLRATRK